jgi:hypothetical protein
MVKALMWIFKVACMKKHLMHISHLTNIPTANVLVKVGFEIKGVEGTNSQNKSCCSVKKDNSVIKLLIKVLLIQRI